jgi:quercetin dioxygenase-like cupin family protein
VTATASKTEKLWFLDSLVRIPVGHSDGTDGVSVVESSAPHGDSPPLHVHHGEDEVFHVLVGELRLRLGESEVCVGAGETVLAPKGTPHTYRVESPDGARWLVVTTNGDFERLVRTVSRHADRAGLPTRSGPPTAEQMDALAAACRECRIELVGPPLQG